MLIFFPLSVEENKTSLVSPTTKERDDVTAKDQVLQKTKETPSKRRGRPPKSIQDDTIGILFHFFKKIFIL